MIYFPQLSTGAVAQLPLRWTDTFRAVVNPFMDGSEVMLSDAPATGVAWNLTYTGLAECERQTLQRFFEQTRGGLKTFTMLDAADNLLAWSEDFTQSCWAPGPLLRITPGAADPFGGTAGMTMTNTAQASQAVSQQINGPGGYRYCLSVYVRSDVPQTVWLTQSCNGATLRDEVITTGSWRRSAMSGAVSGGDGVAFGIQVPSGAQVQVFGAQVEAQPAVGTYKRTSISGGVYENCRFDQDELQMTATAPGVYRCALRIRTTGQTPWRR